jgi:hypothetical protein
MCSMPHRQEVPALYPGTNRSKFRKADAAPPLCVRCYKWIHRERREGRSLASLLNARRDWLLTPPSARLAG